MRERASHPAEPGEPVATTESAYCERLPALVSLGKTLAEAREAQGIPLAVLAEQNYLSADRLSALESGDHTRLPERIYLIAQARRVATSLGLDADQLTESLLDIHLPGVSRRSAPSPAPTSAGQPSGTVARVSLAAPAMAPRDPSSAAQLPSIQKPGRRGRLTWLLAGGAGVLALVAGLAIGTKQIQPSSSNLAKPASTTSESVKPASSAKPADSAKPVDPAKPSQGSLLLSSREPSWLEVRNGEGKELFRGLFTGTGTFSLGAGLEVLAGRPDLITVTTASGQSQTLGTIEQISWHQFTSSGERQTSKSRSSP
ncbi:helix-turn-helix domain-containing protein [Synechococcus sp. J7-Johnson]|uniref:helix-turn-helix domain-containing protein n=1 Tax=Synechococcus sp. J7-Johnson TaxID=2823737 RepID=UPI0020CCCBD6|nr:helix-turn-helix domain-containing protein [Synechococcus sp. J7-Johnson]MCP9840329.1 helix-turn-helix domain-containing protein [Synechococcus sp. J7-Johnson]